MNQPTTRAPSAHKCFLEAEKFEKVNIFLIGLSKAWSTKDATERDDKSLNRYKKNSESSPRGLKYVWLSAYWNTHVWPLKILNNKPNSVNYETAFHALWVLSKCNNRLLAISNEIRIWRRLADNDKPISYPTTNSVFRKWHFQFEGQRDSWRERMVRATR